MRAAVIAIWQLFIGLLFYPLMIGLFMWVYLTDKHWIFGVAIILAILTLDPIWRIIGRRGLDMLRSKE